MRGALVLLSIAACYEATPIEGTDGPGDGPKPGCPADNFNHNSTTLDSRWTRAVAGDGLATAEFEELVLALPVPADGVVKLTTSETFDFTNGEIRIELLQPPMVENGEAQAVFRIELGNVAHEIKWANGLLFAVANGTQSVSGITFGSILHRHWRIRQLDDVIKFETSPDRDAWVEIAGSETTMLGDLKSARATIEISGNTADSATVRFDNFEALARGCIPAAFANVVRDTFTGTPLTDLANHAGEAGADWQNDDGVGIARLDGGRVAHDSSNGEVRYLASGIPPSMDYDVEAEIIRRSTLQAEVNLIARFNDSSDSGYVLSLAFESSDRFTPRLGIMSFGNVMDFAVCSITPSIFATLDRPYRVLLRVRGPRIVGFIDGTLFCEGSDGTQNLPGVTGVIFPGPADPSSGIHVDNFLVTEATQ